MAKRKPTRKKDGVYRLLRIALILLVVSCGPSGSPSSTTPPAATPAPAPSAAAVSLVEPADGVFSGHVDLFRWTAAEGADAYVLRILGSDGRVVFESPSLTTTEARLPKTVALEPEAHTWSVSARKSGETLVTSPVFKFTITP